MKNKNIIKSSIGALSSALLITTAISPISAQAASLVLPRSSWPVCNEIRIDYCVESGTIKSIGTSATPEQLEFIDGIWTTTTWTENHTDNVYAGLKVDVRPANKFTNHLMVNILPVDNAGAVLTQDSNSSYAQSLNLDEQISFTLRSGQIELGISLGAGQTMAIAKQPGKFTITGTPIDVAQAKSVDQCLSEDGVATANVNQLFALVIVENDDSGFGVDGMSGNMNIISNSLCNITTPIWDSVSGSLKWSISAPHFNSDNTVNLGYYRSVIPMSDATLLWGLTDPKTVVSDLSVSVTNSGDNQTTEIRSISYKNGNIIIEHSGFHYSKNTFIVKSKKKLAKIKVCTQLDSKQSGPDTIRTRAKKCPVGYKLNK